MRPIYKALIPAALALVATPVFAHAGHDAVGGLVSGLLHPFEGFDHLLAMILVGVWAALLGGAARLWAPISFIALMALGALLSWNGILLPQIENGIAVSLLVLGLLVALAVRLPLPLAMALTGTFALFHGAAHGAEMPAMASPFGYALGFLFATAALHVVGLATGERQSGRWAALSRASGVVTMAAGLVFIFS